jgi:hypothetical protein
MESRNVARYHSSAFPTAVGFFGFSGFFVASTIGSGSSSAEPPFIVMPKTNATTTAPPMPTQRAMGGDDPSRRWTGLRCGRGAGFLRDGMNLQLNTAERGPDSSVNLCSQCGF